MLYAQNRKPSTGRAGPNGTLNVRSSSGRLTRSTITAMLTRPKANSVPMLVASTSLPSGMRAASAPQNRDTITVLRRGAPVFGWILPSAFGTRPSRAIAKRMRVWP